VPGSLKLLSGPELYIYHSHIESDADNVLRQRLHTTQMYEMQAKEERGKLFENHHREQAAV